MLERDQTSGVRENRRLRTARTLSMHNPNPGGILTTDLYGLGRTGMRQDANHPNHVYHILSVNHIVAPRQVTSSHNVIDTLLRCDGMITRLGS